MESTFETDKVRDRDLHYYRQRFKNRVFEKLVSFFAQEAKERGVTKKKIAERLGRDPAQITRWLSNPSNLTLESMSDLLLALDAEADPPPIVRFDDRAPANFAHPLIERIAGKQPPLPTQQYVGIKQIAVQSGGTTTTSGSQSFGYSIGRVGAL